MVVVVDPDLYRIPQTVGPQLIDAAADAIQFQLIALMSGASVNIDLLYFKVYVEYVPCPI